MAPSTVRRAPYKDFLQPGLQRRFASIALILLVIAYIQAIYFGGYHGWFWTFFPVGSLGIRFALLYLCGLLVIVLRIAQYHVGLRTSNSAFENFTQNVIKLQTLEALVTYGLSAWLFGQLWIWCNSTDKGLNWITYFSGDRARLNEKPIFFTCHFLVLGCLQAFQHLWKDSDRLSLGVVKAGGEARQGSDSWDQFKQLSRAAMPSMLIDAVTQSAAAIILSVSTYALILRPFAWRSALLMFRPFYKLPKTNLLPSYWPFNVWVLWQCLWVGFLISAVWWVGNEAFSTFLVREPLKNGQPLTSESKDPNGSLLNGLRNRKPTIRCFAMWELAFISRDFEIRRKGIYEDIDRKEGPMWSQVYGICLEVIRGMETRIDNYGRAPVAAPSTAVTTGAEKQFTSRRPKEEPVLNRTPSGGKTFRSEIKKVVNDYATDPTQRSQLSPIAKRAIEDAKDKLLEKQKEVTGSDDPLSLLKTIALNILQTPYIGWPFRQEFSRRLTAVVLGTPYGESSFYVNAIFALSQLAVHSLKEDKYGNVQRDVATIIRTLTQVTSRLESFKARFPVHWTDVEVKKDSAEVAVILEALREGLRDLLEAFGPYARDLRLSMTDMRLAREAAGIDVHNEVEKRPEMNQVR